MNIDPFPDEPDSRSRFQVSFDDIPLEIENCFFTGIFRVKMRRIMFIVEHPDDDSEEF